MRYNIAIQLYPSLPSKRKLGVAVTWNSYPLTVIKLAYILFVVSVVLRDKHEELLSLVNEDENLSGKYQFKDKY